MSKKNPKAKAEDYGRLEYGLKLKGCRWCKQPLVNFNGVWVYKYHDAPEPSKENK